MGAGLRANGFCAAVGLSCCIALCWQLVCDSCVVLEGLDWHIPAFAVLQHIILQPISCAARKNTKRDEIDNIDVMSFCNAFIIDAIVTSKKKNYKFKENKLKSFNGKINCVCKTYLHGG